MSPQAVILNIAVVTGIVGIIVYWVRRFAVFRGYKAIEPDVLKVAEALKSHAVRQGRDVVVSGDYGGAPTIVRFSQRVETPGLDIQMRVPATFNFTLMPKAVPMQGEGRVLMRTESAALDRKFNARTDYPMEFRMFAGSPAGWANLEKVCCSSQAGLLLKRRTLRLTELTIPDFTASHVLEHLQAMKALAQRIDDMPGASGIKVEPLPAPATSWPIRVALALALMCLITILFAQPYERFQSSVHASPASLSGVSASDAVHIQRLRGWRVAGPIEFSDTAIRFLKGRGLVVSSHVAGDFSGRGGLPDSAYLLVNSEGKRRLTMLAGGAVAYDAIFSRLDLLARIPKSSFVNIKWNVAPEAVPDGDALLVIENADNPSASLVLLRHDAKTYAARPADFTQIDLASQ